MAVGLVDVEEAARRLGVAGSRVRALIASGDLRAEKIGHRWLVDSESVLARERAQRAPGRPLTARNAWGLLLLASGDGLPPVFGGPAEWRLRQALRQHRLADLESRLHRRARVHHLWALAGELRQLSGAENIALTGSSASGELGLDLLPPDTVDAYVPHSELSALTSEHGLAPVPAREANVMLRSVPDDAWLLTGRRVAPRAAVALDLTSYPDSRSARVGSQLLAEVDAARAAEL